MRMGRFGWMLLAALPLFSTGCGDFWQAPQCTTNCPTDFTLTNSGNITSGLASSGTSTITVTPSSSSFTGTVALSCSVTTSPSGATDIPTCALSPVSLTFSSNTAQTSTLTATTVAGTTPGAYTLTIYGNLTGSAAVTTTACLLVATTATDCSSTTSGSSGDFYILNSTSVNGYLISSGVQTAISGGSVSSLSGASSIAISPDGGVLYVAEAGAINSYTVSSGALTLANTFTGDLAPQAIQVDPSGAWLLDASRSGVLFAIPITSAGAFGTFETQPLANTTPVAGQLALAVTPRKTNTLVAVAEGAAGTQIFSLNSTSLGAGSSPLAPTGAGSAVSVAFGPQGSLMYVGETNAFNSTTNTGALRVFTVGTDSVTEFSYAKPYAPLGTGPHAILPDASGDYVYVASWQTGTTGVITGYSVSSTALTVDGTTVATGTDPVGLAEDNSDGFVFAVSNSGPTLDAYSLPASGGQLASPLTNSTVTAPVAIVAAP